VYLEQYAPDAAHAREYVVTALDAHSGRQIWQVTTPFGGRFVSAAQGRLVMSDNGTLILDTATGKELAHLTSENVELEWNKILYTNDGYNNVFTMTAIDEATGHRLWTSDNVFGGGVAMTPQVIIASGQGMVTAIRVSDGSRLWQVNNRLIESSGPQILGDTVLSSVYNLAKAGHGFIYARRVSDGTLLWKRTMGQSPVFYTAADNVVLTTNGAGADNGADVALRASDGQRL
jgi:outer membrane protein assembly factor BamB